MAVKQGSFAYRQGQGMSSERETGGLERLLKTLTEWGRLLTSLPAVVAISAGAALTVVATVLPEPLKEVAGELGSAFFIAYVIYVFFEFFEVRANHNLLNELFDTHLKRLDSRNTDVNRNVFLAMLGRDLPKGFTLEASRLLFDDQHFVRKSMRTDYEVWDGEFKDAGVSRPFVQLQSRAKFTVVNVSQGRHAVKIGVKVPNPIVLGLIDHVGIADARWQLRPQGNHEGSRHQAYVVTDVSNKLRQAMRDAVRDGRAAEMQPAHFGEVEIGPGDELDVTIEYVMAKETEDNEVLTMAGPTEGLEIHITDRNPGKRVFNMRSIHRTELMKTTPANAQVGRHAYNLEGYLLPKQGVVLWWKESRPEPGSQGTLGGTLREGKN